MKPLAMLCLAFFCGCGDVKQADDENNKVVHEVTGIGGFKVFHARIRGNDYLIAKGQQCISIIPETTEKAEKEP